MKKSGLLILLTIMFIPLISNVIDHTLTLDNAKLGEIRATINSSNPFLNDAKNTSYGLVRRSDTEEERASYFKLVNDIEWITGYLQYAVFQINHDD
jgi:hypothetical protein